MQNHYTPLIHTLKAHGMNNTSYLVSELYKMALAIQRYTLTGHIQGSTLRYILRKSRELLVYVQAVTAISEDDRDSVIKALTSTIHEVEQQLRDGEV